MSSDDSDEDFGPTIPEMAVSVNDCHAPGAVATSVELPVVSTRKRDRSPCQESSPSSPLAKPPEGLTAGSGSGIADDSGREKHDVAVSLHHEYSRSYIHEDGIVDVVVMRSQVDDLALLVTLDAGHKIHWFVKLPKGLFLAKVTKVLDAAEELVLSPVERTASSSLLRVRGDVEGMSCVVERGARDGVHTASLRWLNPSLLEIGCQLDIPAEAAAVMCQRSPSIGGTIACRDTVSNDLVLFSFSPDSCTCVTMDVADTRIQRGPTKLDTCTMNPVAIAELHQPSGLLVAVDSHGIVDYVHWTQTDPFSGQRLWKVVRGLDEFVAKKSTGKRKLLPNAPSWTRSITFSSRFKTDFFHCVRNGELKPIGLSVDSETFVLSATDAPACTMVKYLCYHFATGKIIGTFVAPIPSDVSPLIQRHVHQGDASVLAPCPSGALLEDASSATGTAVWCLPRLIRKVITDEEEAAIERDLAVGETTCSLTPFCVAWSVVAFHRTDGGEAAEPSVLKEFDGPRIRGNLNQVVRFATAEVLRMVVRPTQHLRNFIARTPLGLSLGADGVRTLVGVQNVVMNAGTAPTATEDVMLCGLSGTQMVNFCREQRRVNVRRDFYCAEVVKVLQVSHLQHYADVETPVEPTNSAPAALKPLHLSGGPHLRVLALLTVVGHAQVLRFRLFPFIAPLAVENFKRLCADDTRFYDGLTFHRVIQDFMIQGGCPDGDGTGGRVMIGSMKPFDDELLDASARDPLGEIPQAKWEAIASMREPYLLCMANSGPNTNQSQFFITTAATPWLKGKHTIFGILSPLTEEETGTMRATLHQLERVAVDRDSKPLKPLVIESIRVVEARE